MANEINNNNGMNESANTINAATLGLCFHRFEGNVSVDDVMHQIGADFNVREDKLVRLPQHLLEAVLRGEAVQIPTNYLIQTHKATVHDGFDDTIGIVGESYGTIQNNDAFKMLDLMCNSSVTNTPLKIVSAGLVNNYDPYIQAELPMDARIEGDKSETKFYCFIHTSHDGTSALQVRFSPVRVICQNTFMMNIQSKDRLNFKHSRYASQRIDLTKEENLDNIRKRIEGIRFFAQDYVDKMNSFRLAMLDDNAINEFAMKLFIDESKKENKKLMDEIRRHNYNYDLTETSTRTKNVINEFMNVLHSDDKGQDFARGSKLWLFNATTNYLSNNATYTSPEKRFNSFVNGNASKKIEKTFELLSA